MMRVRNWVFLLGLLMALPVRAEVAAVPATEEVAQDAGKEEIGKICVRLYYATNQAKVDEGSAVAEGIVKRLQGIDELKFANYRELGSDTKPLFRSYENWAQPLQGRDEILVRFEAQEEPQPNAVLLGIELWLSREKVLKTQAKVTVKRPLYVLGPAWRDGRLIIAIERPVVKPVKNSR